MYSTTYINESEYTPHIKIYFFKATLFHHTNTITLLNLGRISYIRFYKVRLRSKLTNLMDLSWKGMRAGNGWADRWSVNKAGDEI